MEGSTKLEVNIMAAASTRVEKTEKPGRNERQKPKKPNFTWGSGQNLGLFRRCSPKSEEQPKVVLLKPLSWGNSKVKVEVSGDVSPESLDRALEAGGKLLSENAHMAPKEGDDTSGYSMRTGSVSVQGSVSAESSASQGSYLLARLADVMRRELDRREVSQTPVAKKSPRATEPRVEPPAGNEPSTKNVASEKDRTMNDVVKQGMVRGMFASMRGVAD